MHYKNSVKKTFQKELRTKRRKLSVRTMRITTDCPDASNKERLALRKHVAHASIH